MPLKRFKNQRHSNLQPRGQLLWTAFVTLTIGFLAVQQASDSSSSFISREKSQPEILTTGNPLSSAAMIRPWEQTPEPPITLGSLQTPQPLTSISARWPGKIAKKRHP